MNRKELLLIVNNIIDQIGEETFCDRIIGDKKNFNLFLCLAEDRLKKRVDKQKSVE